MRFFTDPAPFTHHGRIYGIPVYLSDLDADGPTVAGTNVVADWLLVHAVPLIQWATECLMYAATGGNYVSAGFPFQVRGELCNRKR